MVMITVQRGTPAEEKERRQELRNQIIRLSNIFMPTDEEIAAIQPLQEEYFALLLLGASEGVLALALEKKHLRIFSKIYRSKDSWGITVNR